MKNSVRGISDYLKLVISGIAMGAANVIPGVSGGTMAFILGIYEELIDSIKKFASGEFFRMVLKFEFKKIYTEMPWQFLLAIGIGVLTAIASLAKILSYSLKNYPEITYAFFFGLIIASILMVMKMVRKWSIGTAAALLAGAAAAFLIVTLVPVETPQTWWNLFLCGVIIICAMILPGISGSFLLLILGQYKYVLGSLNLLISAGMALLKGEKIPDADLIVNAVSTLMWISAGCIVGLGAFSHFLNWLFKKFHDITVATLIGFMIGSLWKLWPWQKITEVMLRDHGNMLHVSLPSETVKMKAFLALHPEASVKTLVTHNILPQSFDQNFFAAAGAAAVGFALVLIMEKYASAKDETIEKGE
jgi:putative membrane protein